MNIQELKEDRTVENWYDYEPMDAQYMRYIKSDPSVLAAGHKINDVYHTFCDARGSLLRANYENYGDLCADDDISKLYIRTIFLKNALLEYAICLDLSWQVIWAYVQPSSFEYLVQKKYEEMEKQCTRDNLYCQLDCAIVQKVEKAKKLKELLIEFDELDVVKTIRAIYNSIKHRGMMYFQGFSDESIHCFLFDRSIEMPLQRKIYEPDKIQELLLTYHVEFEKYFNKVILLIMPEDYKINSMKVIDSINILAEIKKIQEE